MAARSAYRSTKEAIMRLELVAFAVSAAAVVVSASGCEDTKAISEQNATQAVAKLLPVVKEDVEQVRRGLPEGAKKLGTLLEADPGANLAGLQQAIQNARGSVHDLNVAKSTFFSFADASGTVLRSEADPDLLANKSVFAVFPELKKALDPSSGNVEVFGEMQEMRGVRTGPDTQWVVAHPVKDPGGQVKGLFVTGWSYRRFAYHLEEMAKRDLIEAAKQESRKKVPLIYVFVLKGKKAYGAPVTPDVNAQAVEGFDLIEKTGSGPWKGSVEITGRTFGVAAQRTPELGPDAGLAVIMSEV
jgi:hypothetical protein